MRTAIHILAGVCAGMMWWTSAAGAAAPKTGRNTQSKTDAAFLTDIPEYVGNVILGRPTDHAITLSVFLQRPAQVRVVCARRGEPLQPKAETKSEGCSQASETNGPLACSSDNLLVSFRRENDSLLPTRQQNPFPARRATGRSWMK